MTMLYIVINKSITFKDNVETQIIAAIITVTIGLVVKRVNYVRSLSDSF